MVDDDALYTRRRRRRCRYMDCFLTLPCVAIAAHFITRTSVNALLAQPNSIVGGHGIANLKSFDLCKFRRVQWHQRYSLSKSILLSSNNGNNNNNKNNNSKYSKSKKDRDRNTPKPLENVSSLFEADNNANKRSTVDKNEQKSKGDGNSNKVNSLDQEASNKQEQLNRLLEYPSFLGSEGLDRDLTSKAEKSSFLDKSPLEGVLPVSELFYRSTPESIDDNEDEDEDGDFMLMEQNPDDEELPFSAEQSNSLETYCNKVQIRRNHADDTLSNDSEMNDDNNDIEDKRMKNSAKSSTEDGKKCKTLSNGPRRRSKMRKHKKKGLLKKRTKPSEALGEVACLFVQESTPSADNRRRANGQKNRKMVRRGMEMLVGGEPINADPPLRVVDLHFDGKTDDWYV